MPEGIYRGVIAGFYGSNNIWCMFDMNKDIIDFLEQICFIRSIIIIIILL